jgi:aryl-alcohol dehydrogenase-like predicted oxidoreductase
MRRWRAQGAPMPDAAAVALIKAVYEAGVTFWDTAEAYNCELPDGSTKFNETVLGLAIKVRFIFSSAIQGYRLAVWCY